MVTTSKFKSMLKFVHMLNSMHCQRKYKYYEFDNIDKKNELCDMWR